MYVVKRMLMFLTCTIFSMMLLPAGVFAEENMIPDYEVKLLLDSDQVLNSDYELKKTYREVFDTGKSYKTIVVAYADTDG